MYKCQLADIAQLFMKVRLVSSWHSLKFIAPFFLLMPYIAQPTRRICSFRLHGLAHESCKFFTSGQEGAVFYQLAADGAPQFSRIDADYTPTSAAKFVTCTTVAHYQGVPGLSGALSGRIRDRLPVSGGSWLRFSVSFIN